MIRRAIIICILSFIRLSSYCQQPTFQKVYDTLGFYYANCVRQTLDHGYILCGSNYTTTNAQDAAIIKTDSAGNLEWVKTYGSFPTDGAICLETTNDSCYMVFGIKDASLSSQDDCWLLKLNWQGDTLFSKILSFGTGQNTPKFCDKTLDGNYILLGYTTVIGNGLQDIYLMKLNDQGDTLWTKTYGSSSGDIGNCVKQTADSGYIITGYTGGFNASIVDAYTIKTDKNGDTLWTKTFGFNNADFGKAVAETPDHGFLVAASSYDTAGTGYNLLLLRYDPSGLLNWFKEYFIPVEDEPIAIYAIPNGGYMIGGVLGNPITHGYLVSLMKIDESGDSIWTRTFQYSVTSSDMPFSLIPVIDGGFVLAGQSDDGPFSRGYMLKTDSVGEIYDGVSEVRLKNELIIFPNPVHSRINIASRNEISEDIEYEMFDISGKIVIAGKKRKEIIIDQINIELLPSGFYLLRISIGKEEFRTYKILVSNS